MEKVKNNWQKIDFIIAGLLIFIALLLRLYKINIPLADLHSWRQADTAAVARNFIKDGIDLFHPRFDDLSPNQSILGLENPNGYRMVEFPIYNAIIAILTKNFPFFPLEIWGRLTTIFFSLIVLISIYYLSLKFVNRITAFFSSFVFSIFPFFVFFSRVILPEMSAVSFAFLAIIFLYHSLRLEPSNKKSSRVKINYYLFFTSTLFFSLSLLIKPTVIFYGIVLIYLFFNNFKFNLIKNPYFYVYFFLSFLPLTLWRFYIQQYPEGVPPSSWLITSVNTAEGVKNIFFKPAFFRWIFFERINNLILGGYLTFFLILGILTKPKNFFLHTIILAGFLYLFVFQGGNVQHEYYQTIILPSLAFGVGLGINTLITYHRFFLPTWIIFPIIIILFSLSFFFSYYKVKDFYYYPPELPQIARIINDLTQPTDKIITDRLGDTTLLYLADRKGAPSIYKDPEELKKIGYSYLVTFDKIKTDKFKKEKKYQIIFENEYFALFKL